MGKLIATTQATVDGVVDPVAECVQADGDHGDYSFERQARSSGLQQDCPGAHQRRPRVRAGGVARRRAARSLRLPLAARRRGSGRGVGGRSVHTAGRRIRLRRLSTSAFASA